MSRHAPDPDGPVPAGEAPPQRERGWRPYWASETTIAEQQRYSMSHMLQTPLSRLTQEAAAAHIEQLAANVRVLGLNAAIQRFVDALVPLPRATSHPEVR